jgi:hypothetical protein
MYSIGTLPFFAGPMHVEMARPFAFACVEGEWEPRDPGKAPAGNQPTFKKICR